MRPALARRLEQLTRRLEELDRLLADPQVLADQARFQALAQERARLQPLAEAWRRLREAELEAAGARHLLQDPDPEVQALAREELEAAQGRLEAARRELEALLLPRDPEDEARHLFLEIRAGTGGDEAALFAGDLARMYARYAERRGWRVETLSASPGEQGGYKEIVLRISGPGAFARLKHESGTHRVQRVPATESQGRIHTSACTVAVLPEPEEVAVRLDPAELRVDTFRASGAGGQHVNKTDSAVRITHLPTGITVECQDERSQHKNRARAMALLQARLLERERQRRRQEQDALRRSQVGSGDRSERIRTYNFPQGRVTDHRIGLTLYQLEQILDGDLDPLVEPLLEEERARRLAALEEEPGREGAPGREAAAP
ncbi:MAG: peptide chain release factor 1 [Gammaproteobacteria bacterium]|nr:MAG: peptide chain release factor 1 [Gammaproteobacteria bacterium]